MWTDLHFWIHGRRPQPRSPLHTLPRLVGTLVNSCPLLLRLRGRESAATAAIAFTMAATTRGSFPQLWGSHAHESAQLSGFTNSVIVRLWNLKLRVRGTLLISRVLAQRCFRRLLPAPDLGVLTFLPATIDKTSLS